MSWGPDWLPRPCPTRPRHDSDYVRMEGERRASLKKPAWLPKGLVSKRGHRRAEAAEGPRTSAEILLEVLCGPRRAQKGQAATRPES